MMTRHNARQVGLTLCGILALASADSAAQEVGGVGPSRAFYLVPSVTAEAQITNNVRLSSTDPQSDLILSLTPRLQLGGQSGRVRGFLDYAPSIIYYVRDEESGSFQNNLNARVSAEAVENWLFVDAYANISQQYISPFGSQSPDSSLINSNRTEVFTFGITPYVAGQVAGVIDYRVQVNYQYTNSGTSEASDSSLWGGAVNIAGTTRFPKLGWGIDSTYTEYNFSNSDEPTTDFFTVGSLSYAVTPYLKISARANTETSNLVNQEKQTSSGWGAGIYWSPSPRTNLSLTKDQRFFGSSWDYSFDYRTPQTVWKVSSHQGLSTGAYNPGRGSSGSPYDLLFAQFARVEPDPAARAQLVNDYMQRYGIDPNGSLNSGFLPTEITEERRQEISVAFVGIRSTVTFNAYQTHARSLVSAVLAPDDDFANGNIIRWRGYGVNWGHRLTPLSTINLRADQIWTTESVGGQDTKLWTIEGAWSTQLAQRAQASVRARRIVFTSTSAPYNESALIANLTMTF